MNRHHGGSGEIFRQKSDLDRATRATVASPTTSVRSDEDEETPTAKAVATGAERHNIVIAKDAKCANVYIFK